MIKLGQRLPGESETNNRAVRQCAGHKRELKEKTAEEKHQKKQRAFHGLF